MTYKLHELYTLFSTACATILPRNKDDLLSPHTLMAIALYRLNTAPNPDHGNLHLLSLDDTLAFDAPGLVGMTAQNWMASGHDTGGFITTTMDSGPLQVQAFVDAAATLRRKTADPNTFILTMAAWNPGYGTPRKTTKKTVNAIKALSRFLVTVFGRNPQQPDSTDAPLPSPSPLLPPRYYSPAREIVRKPLRARIRSEFFA